MKTPLLLGLALSFPASAATLSERVDKVLNRFAPYQLSGSLTVLGPGTAVYQARDLADERTGWKNDQSTIFLIASNTKTMTAAAILRLQEQGKLKVKDPVSKHIPELAQTLKGATVENLLQHTSGVPSADELPPVKGMIFKRKYGIREVLASLQGKKPKFKPGSKFEYSNTGYMLLGEIIRRKSEGTYGQFLQKEFFGPLGLGDTGVGPPAGKEGRTAASYEPAGKGRGDYLRANGIKVPHLDDDFSEGNVYSSSQELARWGLEVAQGHVLSAESTKATFTPGKVKNYGYGWYIGNYRGHRMVSHLGSWLGFRSILVVFPDDGISFAWNGNSSLPEKVHDQLADELQGAVFP